MRSPLPHKRSRRDFFSSYGIGLVAASLVLGAGGAFAQVSLPTGPGGCGGLPAVGKVRVAGIDLIVNGAKLSACGPGKPLLPVLSAGLAPNKGFCALELAGGIDMSAEVALVAAPGLQKPYFGKLGFVQFTQYTHQRSPSGPASGRPNPNYACARSSGAWELDGSGPNQTYNDLFSCGVPPDPNTAHCACAVSPNGTRCVSDPRNVHMADNPFVATEDAQIPYDTVFVGPVGRSVDPDRFRTWLVWDETDDNKPETPTNQAKRHPLTRVDWVWQGKAGDKHKPGATCPSSVHTGHGWDAMNLRAAVTGVFFGPAAGAPPTKYIRAHNNAWVAGPC